MCACVSVCVFVCVLLCECVCVGVGAWMLVCVGGNLTYTIHVTLLSGVSTGWMPLH